MKYLPDLIGPSFRRLVLTALVASLVASALHAAPSIAAGGGAISVVTHNAPPVVVDPLLAVTGDLPFANASVRIDNYKAGDVLSCDNAALQAGVTGSWNSSTGVLSFSGSASPADWQALFRTVKIATTSGDITPRTVTFNAGTAQYFAGTGHFYEFVPASGISWDAARDAAAARNLYGLQGYLVTVTSAEENTFVGTKLSGQGWMGASDVAQESIWRWVTGPEGLLDSGQGLHFFTQDAASANSPSLNSVYGSKVGGGGAAIGGAFIGWRTIGNAEPNDYNPGEDYGIFLGVANWNDYNIAGGDVPSVGYVVEYGGMPGDPVVSVAASSLVTVIMPAPTVAAVSPSVDRTDGGATITITGTNFIGASAVKFGATPAISYSVVSDTSISGVIAPAGSVGTVDITVTNAGGTSGIVANDQFTYITPLATCTVTSNFDSGAGSLRDAIRLIASDGIITLAPGLSGKTIVLTSTLSIPRSLTIDGSALEPHLQISGNGVTQVMRVGTGLTVTLAHLDIINGRGASCGGISNDGTLTVRNCTVRNNQGMSSTGGVYNRGILTIENSTISNNIGGGITNGIGATLALLNCTLSGNQASGMDFNPLGGGVAISNSGQAVVNYCTIVNNTATVGPGGTQYGIYVGNGTLTLNNSIVANNGASGTDNFSVTGGSFTSLGYNLSNNWNGRATTTGDQTAAIVLDALADNNGDTQTRALQADSPAIDAADSADTTATDQRGFSRLPHAKDIGAYEEMPDVTSVDVPAGGTYAAGEALDFTVHFSSAVTVGGTPRITLTIGGSTRYADYSSGSGTTALVFRYTVQPGDTDTDGITAGPAIDLNGGTLSGELTLKTVGVTSGINVDAPLPTLTKPTLSNLGANQVTLTLQSSATGTGYFTLLAAGEFAGSAAQTRAGQKSTGTTAYRHGSLPLTAATNSTYTVRNLSAATNYTVCFTADDGSTLAAGVDSSATFKTADATDLTHKDWRPVGTAGISAGGIEYMSLAIAPDGALYVAYKDNSNGDKAMVMKFNGTAWETVGTAGFSAGRVEWMTLALAPDGTPFVAYSDWNNGHKVTVVRLNGTSWELAGTGGVASYGYYPSLAFAPDGSPYVAYSDAANNYKATVMRLNGVAWEAVGTAGFSVDRVEYTNLAFAPNGTPYVAYSAYPDGGSSNDSKATVMLFNGTAWELAGTAGFSAGEAYNTNLAFAPDGTPYVAYMDCGLSYKASVMRLNGTAWEAVGTAGFSNGGADFTNLAISPDGTPYVAFRDSAKSNNATVMKFNGTAWVAAGTTIISAEADYTSLAFAPDGSPYVAFRDAGGGSEARVMKMTPLQLPTVTAVSPSTGTMAGGTTVTITGTHFTGASDVEFGSTPASTFSVVDDTTITATAPAAGTAGAFDVTVTTLGGTSATSANDQFTYVAPISTYTVINNTDSGPGTLREAIGLLDVDGTITFDASLSGKTIPLHSQLAITKKLTIDGSALDSHVKISGGGTTGVFVIGATVTLAHLDIIDGTGFESGKGIMGGGIFNVGTLTMESCNLSGNSAGIGGGIVNLGILTVQNCTLADNWAINGGGGIANFSGSVTLSNCTLTRNTAPIGGGIANLDKLTMLNCTLSGNQATGPDPAKMGGGAIAQIAGEAILDHCTIVGNTAASPNEATSGIWVVDGTPTLKNSIVANNGADGTGNFSVTGGSFTSLGYNLSNAWNGPVATNDLEKPVVLGALADNGGKTQTCALQAGSPAIDAADPADPAGTDQRGFPRPEHTSDIGAYEYLVATITTQPAAAIGTALGNTSFTVAATGTNLSYQWQADFGTGFGNIVDGGVYGGATTDTLTLTGMQGGMNGYSYRVVVTSAGVVSTTSSSATLTVNKATPTVSWAAPSAITYGTALSPTQLNATGSVAGSMNYAPAAGTVLLVGANQNLGGTFTPTDAVNYSTASTTVTITVTQNPTPPPAPSTGSLSTTDSTPTLTGTAEPGSTVTVYDGSTVLGTTTTAGDGTWSFTPSAALTDGTHTITLTVTDTRGQTSIPSSGLVVAIDTAAPAAPSVSGTPSATTADTKPTITGTAEAGSTVKIYDGSTLLGTATVNAGGEWTYTPTTPLGEGVHTITTTSTDTAGNTSAVSPALTVTIDTIAPVAPAISTVTATTVSGTAEAGSTVKIFDGSTLLGTSTTASDGTWSLPVTLVDGTHSLTATATDGSGNVGTGSTVITPTIDTVAPAAPVFSTTTILANDTTPTLTGTAEAGSTVKIYDGATLLGTTTAVNDGTWSFTPTLALSEGAHVITAKATDGAGNTGATSPAVSLTIDTTAPVSPAIANVTATTVSGTAEAGSMVKIFDGSTLLGTTTTASDGTWSLPVTLADGTHSLTATATDGSGNTGTGSTVITPTIDTVAPAAPVFSTTTILANDTKPTLTGNAEAGSTVKVYDGATLLGATTAGSDGTWSFTPTLALSEGAHAITAKATDAAGNTGAASSAVSLTIDITAPVSPAITNVTATTVSGTAEAGSTVKIFDGSTLLGTTTTASDGTWSLPVTLVDGAHSLNATATDGSGNTGTGSTVITPTIDTVAPAAPVISNTSGNTTVKMPTLAGTAEAGSTVKIYEGSTLLGTTNATGGAWSFTLATPLTDGTHAIIAKATDSAGNISTAAPLTLVVGTAPAITTSPVAQTVAAGSAASFTVSANGTAALGYQWQESADNTVFTAVSGASSASYSITSATVASTGYYRVVVTNTFGTATSPAALLSVTPDYVAPKPDGSAAAVTGGTGTGSQSVTVLTTADFITYATSPRPYVITVIGTLNIGAVNVTSNKTIQGADGSATLLGNLNLGNGVSNIVIRGLNLTNPGTMIANGAYTDGGDALTLSGASNVFVTHTTFSDCADHAMKIINGSDNVTVSWCEFYNTSSTLLHRTSVQIGNGSESKPLHVTLHHNWWTTNVDQQMPLSAYGYVHEYNNYFASAGNTSGTVVSDQSQLLSERNVYAGLANPLTKQTVNAALTAGKVRVIGNLYTSCTGTTPDAGTDTIFTPVYSYEMLPTSDVATEVSTLAGNTAGAGSSDAVGGTATLVGPTAAVVPGTSFTLNSTPSGFTVTTYQWRLNNVDVAGATASTYTCSNTQTANVGTYAVAISMASGDTVVSTPFVVALGSPPPSNNGNSGSSGGGSFGAWFYAALALFGSLRVMRRRIH